MKNLLKIFIIVATIFSQTSFAYDDNNPEANEFSDIKSKIKIDPRNGLMELFNCANKNNKYCAFLVGYLYYHKKEYSKAYPYFLKSEGVFKAIKSEELFKGLNGKEVDTSDVFLGNMFSEGLGVEKNMNKAIDYYNRCMTMGDDACAYDISTLFVNDPVRTYAYTLVAQKLQMATGTYDEHAKVNIPSEVKTMQQNLNVQQTMEGDKLANEICSTIPSCHTNQTPASLTPSQDAAHEMTSIYNEYKNSSNSSEDILYGKIQQCSEKGNKWCSFAVGHYYFDKKEYTKAYPYLLKSEGILKTMDGQDFAPADLWLGKMFADGLGVEKNRDKAIEYYNKCLSTGEKLCAYNLMTLFIDDQIKSYAMTQIARKLGMKKLMFAGGLNIDISTAIKQMQQALGEQKTKEGDKLAIEICTTIPKCKQSKL